ncbi:hypothetical protein FA15DRAFT_661288 [Coprinopsis marcescibilis]|uniref:Uncharacterized protein n=1 Tax=Coprinopsis marcescibilis TaxID=230819 RepID=A0A5C3KCI9_COPMA|nr:hypothetical protein FA15DRAFT_661288 [Coprinopsis marcescibilis]
MLDFVKECYNDPSKPNSNKPVDPGMLVQFKEEHKSCGQTVCAHFLITPICKKALTRIDKLLQKSEMMGQNLNGEGSFTSVTRSRLHPPTPPSNSPKKAFQCKKDDLARKMAKAVEDLWRLAGNGVPEQSFSTLFTQCLLCNFVVPIHLEIPYICERKPLKREHNEEADNEGQSAPSIRKRQ